MRGHKVLRKIVNSTRKLLLKVLPKVVKSTRGHRQVEHDPKQRTSDWKMLQPHGGSDGQKANGILF